MNPRMRRRNESAEERMRLMRFAMEFGVELAGDIEGMLGQLDDLYQLSVGSMPAENPTGLLEPLAIGIVEFVAMTVSLIDHERAVKAGGLRANDQLTRL